MAEAKQWCDRILVMLHGRVIEELDARNDEPQHPYSKVLFDPWAGPVPEFPDNGIAEIEPNDADVCDNEDREPPNGATMTGMEE